MKFQINTCRVKHRFLALVVFTTFVVTSFAQTNWNLNGNSTTNGNFLGTTNNEPLIFKANSLEALRIKPNGDIKVASFENIGKGIVTFNNNGVLTNRVFPNDTNQVFCGSGNFKSVAALSGWTRTGNVLYNSPGVKVGIGTNNPQYALDVVGSAYFTGTITTQGVILADKMQVDTMEAGAMFTLNNRMFMNAGGVNEFYTVGGDLRIQSNMGNTFNVIMQAGTNGNVGIGVYNPAYKLDVAGTVRFSNDVYVSRLRPLAGDSVVAIGDSSVLIGTSGIYNKIRPSQRGLGIGSITALAGGANSLAIGQKVKTSLSATNAIVIGSGVIAGIGVLENTTPNSMMIGFNSDKPTMFVAPASGAGAIGKIGIGTVQPDALFQVGDGFGKITIAPTTNGTQGAQTTLGFNVHQDPSSGWYVARGNGTFNAGSAITQDQDGALRFYVFSNSGGTDQTVDQIHFETKSILTLRPERVQIGQAELLTTSIFNTPDTKLAVDGRIVCKDLVVSDVDWQDEVFDSTYYLIPIDSVASYISVHGHLPGVNDETVIEQNGMSVSETITMQQQKIEELTLYIIQLDARMKAIEEENAELKESQPK